MLSFAYSILKFNKHSKGCENNHTIAVIYFIDEFIILFNISLIIDYLIYV